ncbi:hypothetical protein ACEPPN_008221 [Leptodophora sp. 'Broadleaf-Isolate-01']
MSLVVSEALRQEYLSVEIATGTQYAQERDHSGLLDLFVGSKYPDVGVLASLAVVKDGKVDVARRMRLCTSGRSEAGASGSEEGADEKYDVFVKVPTAELEKINEEKQDVRRKPELTGHCS